MMFAAAAQAPRAALGPTRVDRALGVNTVGTVAALLPVVCSWLDNASASRSLPDAVEELHAAAVGGVWATPSD